MITYIQTMLSLYIHIKRICLFGIICIMFIYPQTQHFANNKRASFLQNEYLTNSNSSYTQFLPMTSPYSKNQYKYITLKNNLDIFIVSNPSFKKSAAAMAIKVGSMNDPKETQGLAHFLEHMLFLATEKYPKLNQYQTFLEKNEGYSNAYTAMKLTNYYFIVNPSAYEEALDRFSQFFIAPLLDPQYIKKEREAVNAEFEKNMLQDNWRAQELRRHLYIKSHPARTFAIGNTESLKNVTETQLRTFFNRYYQANNMKLVLAGPQDIKTLETLAKSLFDLIPNNTIPSFKAPSKFMDPKGKYVTMLPIKDTKNLLLFFPTPDLQKFKDNKTYSLINTFISSKEKGSLEHRLKEASLINSLYAGAYDEGFTFGGNFVSFDLTPNGEKQTNHIIQSFFSLISQLKEQGFPYQYYISQQELNEINYLYPNQKTAENTASDYAAIMSQTDTQAPHQYPFRLKAPNLELYKEYLSIFTPDNMFILQTTHNVTPNKTAPFFNTQYKITTLDNSHINSFLSPASTTPFTTVSASPYLKDASKLSPQKPINIYKDKNLSVWYKQETEFLKPKTSISAKINLPATFLTNENSTILSLWIQLINESLTAKLYTLNEIGGSASISFDGSHIYLKIYGLNTTIVPLTTKLFQEITAPSFNESMFNRLKESTIRHLSNSEFDSPLTISGRLTQKLLKKNTLLPKEKIPYLQKITFEDTINFLLPHNIFLTMFAYGNETSSSIIELSKQIQTTLLKNTQQLNSAYENTYTKLNKKNKFITTTKDNNYGFRTTIQIGPRTPKNRAIGRIIDRLTRSKYFTEMRTEKKLGYIVGSASRSNKHASYLIFVIISPNTSPKKLSKLTQSALKTYLKEFGELTPSEFQALKNSILTPLYRPAESEFEKASTLQNELFVLKQHFGQKEQLIQALKSITQKEVIESFKKSIGKQEQSIEVWLYKEKDILPKPKNRIKHLKTFLKNRTFFN